jgi:hypothetical protein
MTTPATKWYTTAEAARVLGITRARICQLHKRGQWEIRRIDASRYLISNTSVEAYRVERDKHPLGGNPNWTPGSSGNPKRRRQTGGQSR